MSSFAERMAEDRRLALLQALAEMPGYEANETVLRTALDHVGFRASRDVVRAEMTWLSDFNLLRIERLAGPHNELWVGHLTGAGQDVTAGRMKHHGISRPEAV